uniref:Putative 1-aminocyclopropane-1-carboxylate deaminase n=1 Tax=Lygus hesperus TaxID=30085 RepID=A0A0A9XY15_LYGHE
MLTRLQQRGSLYTLLDDPPLCTALRTTLQSICLQSSIQTIQQSILPDGSVGELVSGFHTLLLQLQDPLDAFAVMGVYQGLLLHSAVQEYYQTVDSDVLDTVHSIVHQILMYIQNVEVQQQYPHTPIRVYACLTLVNMFHSSTLSKQVVQVPTAVSSVAALLADPDPVLRTLAAICVANFTVRFSEFHADDDVTQEVRETVSTVLVEALLYIGEHVGKEEVALAAYYELIALCSLIQKNSDRG